MYDSIINNTEWEKNDVADWKHTWSIWSGWTQWRCNFVDPLFKVVNAHIVKFLFETIFRGHLPMATGNTILQSIANQRISYFFVEKIIVVKLTTKICVPISKVSFLPWNMLFEIGTFHRKKKLKSKWSNLLSRFSASFWTVFHSNRHQIVFSRGSFDHHRTKMVYYSPDARRFGELGKLYIIIDVERYFEL